MSELGWPVDTMALFVLCLCGGVGVDLYQHRRGEEVTARNAGAWSVFWVVLALGFAAWLHVRHGAKYTSVFITGYVLEKTLSVDNLMVFIAVFEYFKINSAIQHRVLHYGIIGAVLFRAIFVGVGSGVLLAAGPWAELIFAAFVAWAALKMLRGSGDKENGDAQPKYEEMFLVKTFGRFFPVVPYLAGPAFFVGRSEAEVMVKNASPPFELKAGVKRWMTPVFVCLLVIEGSDVLFAFDSVPVVIAVTKEPLLIFAAMMFAVLGLRSMYFLLLILTRYLVHLEKAVVLILFFISVKLLLGAGKHWFPVLSGFEVRPFTSLAIVLGSLLLGVVASLIWPGAASEAVGTAGKP